MKFIDIHAHLNFVAYDKDRDAVIVRADESDTVVINVGTQYSTSQQAVDLAGQHEHLYAIIGLHPIHTAKSYHDEQEIGEGGEEFTSRGEVFDAELYKKLAQSSGKIVGIGECGLDYYRTEPESLEKQKTAFHAQIELAIELDLPLMLHVRPSQNSMDAYWDVIEILKKYKAEHGDKLRGDAHFFAGDVDVAKVFLDLGFYLSFTGVITFAKDYEEVIRMTPINKIMTETDCPYVTPAPHRGQRNEPVYVQEVTKKIAEIKELSLEEVKKQVFENARELFGIR